MYRKPLNGKPGRESGLEMELRGWRWNGGVRWWAFLQDHAMAFPAGALGWLADWNWWGWPVVRWSPPSSVCCQYLSGFAATALISRRSAAHRSGGVGDVRTAVNWCAVALTVKVPAWLRKFWMKSVEDSARNRRKATHK